MLSNDGGHLMDWIIAAATATFLVGGIFEWLVFRSTRLPAGELLASSRPALYIVLRHALDQHQGSST